MAVITDNLSGMRSRVRRWLHELSNNTSFWSNTFIDQQINVSYRRRSAQLTMAFEGYFTNVATRDLVADQERYAWPPGFERLSKIELIRVDGSRVPIQRNERHYQRNPYTAAGSGQDSYLPTYRPISGGFVLEPPPSVSITNGIQLEYNGLPTQLSNDGDSLHSDFPRSFDEIVILDAAIACLDSEGLLEGGPARTIVRARMEWEMDWERFIDGKILSNNRITPFPYHYGDS